VQPRSVKEVVRFDNVTLKYENETVFQDLSFSLPEGSFHFLTGVSGAGKTSLLKLIYLAHTHYQGSIRLLGHNLRIIEAKNLPRLRQQIGVVFQNFNLLDHLSALDNVTLPLRIIGMNYREAKHRATKMLAWVGLGDQLHALPKTLSGGQQQRVVIARAVVVNPKILLADEPTGNVDDEIAMKLINLFNALNQMGTTVIIATHNRDLVAEFSHPTLHLSNKSLSIHPHISPYTQNLSTQLMGERA